jgi:hypothetical protein
MFLHQRIKNPLLQYDSFPPNGLKSREASGLKYKSFLLQRIKIRCYNMVRSYGTIVLQIRAIGSAHFVRLDFSPVDANYPNQKRAVGSVHVKSSKTYLSS